MTAPRLGFFTRLLEDASASDRYRFALEQIVAAERYGFASAWIAQHHFGEHEGGLPSPFVLLAAAADRTTEISLGTAVVTLPIDDPVRAAEDAAVVDLLSGGRLQLGVAGGGTDSSFAAFGEDPGARREVFASKYEIFRDALAGRGIRGTDSVMYPRADGLDQRIWQATFSADGARRAAAAGDGLMLSRTQPKPDGATLSDVQLPIIQAYREGLPAGAPVRVLASRTAVVVDEENRGQIEALARPGLTDLAGRFLGVDATGLSLAELAAVTDTHVGTVDEVVASLAADEAIFASTDVSFQVHSIAATHELTLRSLELLGTAVAPALGIATGAAAELHGAHRAVATHVA